jgi:WD40 repeat protein
MLAPLAERYNASAMSFKALPRPVLRFSALFALALPSPGLRGLAHAVDAGSATASPPPGGRAGEGAPSSLPPARPPAGAREAGPRPLPFELPETLRPLLKARKLRLANAWGGYALRGSALAVAVGGGRGIAAGPSGTRIWDLDTGRQLHLLPMVQDGAESVAITLDGRLVATGGHDGTVLLWDVDGGRVRALLRRHAGDVSALAFSRDGRALASGGADGVVRVWEVARGRGAQVFFGHKDVVRALAFSPDGRSLFSACDDGSVRVWNLARGRLLRTLGPVDGAEVTALAIAEDGRRALAAEDGRGVRLWDLEAGLPLGFFEDAPGVRALAFAPDGTRALAARTTRREGYPAGDRTGPGLPELEVRVWDPSKPGTPRSFSRRHDGLSAAAFSADAELLLSSEGGALKLWDVTQGRERRETSGHAGAVACIALSPDGTRAITAAADHTARLWDVGSGSELFVFGGYVEQVRSAAFSPTGKLALVADLAGTQKLWDLETGDQVRQLGVHRGLQTVGFLKDGLGTFSASCDRIALWDVASGRETSSIAFSKLVDRVAFSPGGGLALSFGSIDGPQLWELSNGKVIQTLARPHRHARAAALSPDGRMAAVATAPAEIGAGADVIELWGVGGGLLPPSLRAREGVEALAFSPDGRLLLSASASGDVSLFSLPLRREVSHLELGPNAERPTALAFGANGLSLFVGTSLGGILHFLLSEDPLR